MNDSTPVSIKTLLCDMGNVLVFFCHERMCRQIGELCGRTATEIRTHLLETSLQWEYERGYIDDVQLHDRLEEQFNCLIDLPELMQATADIFELNSTMIPVLEDLKSRGLRLVLFSNTCTSHVNYIREHWNFLDLFDHLLLSYQVGAIKPEEKMYRAALPVIDCDPTECLYIDDIASYIDKAREFGLNAEVFTTTENFVETLSRYKLP